MKKKHQIILSILNQLKPDIALTMREIFNEWMMPRKALSPAWYTLCETNKTVSTTKLLEQVEKAHDMLNDGAVLMRDLINLVHEKPEPTVRKRLTKKEIIDLIPIMQNGWDLEIYSLWFARAIERAHGIKEQE